MLQNLKKSSFQFPNTINILREIKKVSRIENRLFPNSPKLKGLDLDVSMIPSETVGGDCYDIIVNKNHDPLIYVSDVTGHGLSAGMIVSAVNFLIFSLAKFCNDPKEILSEANRILKDKTNDELFVTTIMGKWNSKKNLFQYVQAGHQQIIHYKAQQKKAYIYPAGGIALGILPEINNTLEIREIFLEKNDVLFLYSDGITEAWSDNQGLFGIRRFINIIEKSSILHTSNMIKNEILKTVQEFSGNTKQSDDITLMVMKRNNS